jgi:hypothetical protein
MRSFGKSVKLLGPRPMLPIGAAGNGAVAALFPKLAGNWLKPGTSRIPVLASAVGEIGFLALVGESSAMLPDPGSAAARGRRERPRH